MSDQFGLDLSLLAAYVGGECSPESRASVEAWIAERAEHGALVAQLRTALQRIVLAEPSALDVGRLKQEVLARIGTRAPQTAPNRPLRARPWPTTPSGRYSTYRPLFRASLGASLGILAIVAAFGTVLYRRGQTSGSTQRYQTLPGQQSTVRLADGSVVLLAPSTSLAMTGGTAEVTGEAYFTIAPNPSRPFLVKTKNAVVQVLGTRFAVRQYAEERSSRVVVEEGKVLLQSAQPHRQGTGQAIVSARMLGRVTDSAVTVTSEPLAAEYTAWTQGRLIFRSIPLRDVVADLQRAYGVEIRVTDTVLARQRMTLTVSVRTEPVTQILDLVTQVTDAHYTRAENVFVVAPGRASTRAAQPRQFPQPEKQYGR